jgi:hypothetical protein
MASKADFTTDEWAQLRQAPFMAGLAVVAASPSGPFGVLQEMFAVGRMLAEVKSQGASSELVKGLVADLEGDRRNQSAPAELTGKKPEEILSFAVERCREIASMVERKAAPGEAQAFKQWLVSVSQKVAEAAKEGGFLGFGGTQVSAQESAAVQQLSAALGVKA